MGSGSTWARVMLGAEDNLYVAQSDIQDCFWNLGLDPELGLYFCLPPVKADLLASLVAQVRQEIDAGGEALLDARDNQRECDNALRDAERSRKEHREEAVLLRKAAKAHAVMLANFDKLLKVFASLVCGT